MGPIKRATHKPSNVISVCHQAVQQKSNPKMPSVSFQQNYEWEALIWMYHSMCSPHTVHMTGEVFR